MSPVHLRMPVILSKRDQVAWMSNQEYHPELLKNIMQPYSGNDLICYPVSREMNHSRFESEQAIQPLKMM